MTVTPWPEYGANSNTKFIPMMSGYAWYDPTGVGLSTSTGVYLNIKCKLVSFSSNYIYLFDGANLNVYDLTGVLLSTYSVDIAAIYPDMAFSKDGRMLRYNGASIVQRGSYSGIPVAASFTISDGKLFKYSQMADGRYSLSGKYDSPTTSGEIIASGFDTTNSKFVIVSEFKTLVFSYDYNYDFTLLSSYNHARAVGISEGTIIFDGDGEPGKITDVFDFT